jgi:hypothetical protein
MNVARKSILSILGAATLLFVMATRAGSQDATNQAKSSSEPTREESRQRRARSGAKGVLKEIDLLRHQLKLTTEDGPRTFTYTSRTYFFRDKEKIAADNLKIGEVVALQLNTDKDGAVNVLRVKARTPSELMEPPSTGPPDTTNAPAVSQP